VAHQGTIIDVTSLLQQMELKRQEDREQQERAFQIFMQQQMQQIQQVQQQIQQVQQQQQIQPREERRARRRSPSVDSYGSEERRRRPGWGGERRHQVQHQRQPPPIKIPKFKRKHDPNAYMEWEQKVDQIFSIHRVSDQEQVELVVLEFEKYVITWWHQICMDNYNQEPPAASWMDIKVKMRELFRPSYHRRETLLKLQRLQQGSMCVEEYFKLMESILLKVGLHDEHEEEKVTRFVSGLRREIQDVVDLYEYSTLSKVLHLALKVENQLKRKQKAKKSTSYNFYYSKPWKGKEKKDFKTPSKSSQDPTPKPNSTRTMHDKPTSSQES